MKIYLAESVSKWVDAYHGTPHGSFKEFSYEHRGRGADTYSTGDYGKGFYFSPDINKAKDFALHPDMQKKIKHPQPTLYKVKLNMNNPLDLSNKSNVNKGMNRLISKYGVFNIPDEEYKKLYNSFGMTEDDYHFMIDIEGYIQDNWGDWDIDEMLAEKGYDSIISHDGSEYVVFKPEQIKIEKIISL